MTSQLNVDTIVDKAGSGGSNVKMANTSTYVSEGGNVTQNTVQGLAKAWITYKGTSTNAIMDSLNMSGVVDNGTGDYTMSFTNNMSDGEYSLTDGSERLENNNSPSITGFETTASGSYIHNHWDSGFSASDMFRTYSQATGDLA